MTDKELLELAAKAAGIYKEPVFYSNDGVISFGDKCTEWDPLNEDGDALRLVVILRLPLSFTNKQTGKCSKENKYGLEAWVDCGRYWHSSDSMYYPHDERLGEDPCADTRRAIVRAAAEIGKGMK